MLYHEILTGKNPTLRARLGKGIGEAVLEVQEGRSV